MLSIIIPTFNEEEYLPLLLKQIQKQSFIKGEEDKSSSSPARVATKSGEEITSSTSLSLGESSVLEIIIADADSQDRTVKIAKSFGCKIVKGGLPAKGRNEGAKVAQGDIFLFMDADNIFLPQDFLEQLIEQFEKRNLDCASFPIYMKGDKLDKLLYGIYNFWTNITQNFLPHAFNSILIKKELHQKINGYDEEIKLAEDHSYARKAARFGKFGFIKTKPVLTSSRRFKRDGKLKSYLKYALAGIYLFFLGDIKTDIFKYRFGYSFKNKKK